MPLKLPSLFGLPSSASGASTSPAREAERASNRQMLGAALQDTLQCNGIPQDWVSIGALVRTGKSQEPRLDVRLTVRHWDENLVLSSMALQEDFKRRLQVLDPSATQWLTAVSWQFALADGADYPKLASRDAPAAPPASAPLAGREALARIFDESSQANYQAERAYAATVPAALH